MQGVILSSLLVISCFISQHSYDIDITVVGNCKRGNRRTKFTQSVASPGHLTSWSVPGIPLLLAPWGTVAFPLPSSLRWELRWQRSDCEGSKAFICPQEAAPLSASPNYLSPDPPPLPLHLTLPMMRKHRSSLKFIPPSYWHKLKLAVAHAVNSVGSRLIIFVNWKIDFFFISTICTFRTFFLTLYLLGHVFHWK